MKGHPIFSIIASVLLTALVGFVGWLIREQFVSTGRSIEKLEQDFKRFEESRFDLVRKILVEQGVQNARINSLESQVNRYHPGPFPASLGGSVMVCANMEVIRDRYADERTKVVGVSVRPDIGGNSAGVLSDYRKGQGYCLIYAEATDGAALAEIVRGFGDQLEWKGRINGMNRIIAGIAGLLLLPTLALAGPVTWMPPTTHVDGTPLTDLAGFVVKYTPLGVQEGPDTVEVVVMDPDAITAELPAGVDHTTHWFLVQAVRANGIRSAYATPTSWTIPALPAMRPANVTVVNNIIQTLAGGTVEEQTAGNSSK